MSRPEIYFLEQEYFRAVELREKPIRELTHEEISFLKYMNML